MNVIRLNGVYKSYGNGENEVKALKNINLDIKKGEFVSIIGASGSGKSTLLHILGGLDKANQGDVFIDGINLKDLSENKISLLRLRKIGFVFQFYNLIPVLTVEENIEMPVLLDDGAIDKDYKNELIKLLGLENKLNNLPSELSGGQQQRVAIGRALANRPSIILADEPTGNLDSKTAMDIMELLKYSRKKYNQTLILITHDERIAKMADRVIGIKDGEIAINEVI
ncbi:MULTISPECIES: ABC transporter ATP-binding protein [Clostridium]|uniref:ABC transporter ATP-binding protein n=1 Tax=Clostridium TaxID=1485 RepID=UPI0013FB872A|nr:MULTISPECIES: ABC transporter ATP-binding protein [Clostridium]MBY6810257.1 ABC transporter ATP-binding protein [Clostridium botulinum]MBY6823387.1 ABC transporter ATP-binding protein [Clostridium botulinum]MBY6834117.1 ABC transporter ATP-binding protein [Clostridium botulinum]MBY6972464.1 ABC transporter ATP-binding protein [Clostridium botulinum]MCS6104537.1 ABC transporter ATP-binding protein [Clostridium botulinum]